MSKPDEPPVEPAPEAPESTQSTEPPESEEDLAETAEYDSVPRILDAHDVETTVNLTGDIFPLPGRDDLAAVTQNALPDAAEAPLEAERARIGAVRAHLAGLLEALVFASDRPIKAAELAKAAAAPLKDVKDLLGELKVGYAHRGVQLDEVAGGWIFRTSAAYAPFVRDLTKQKPVKLTRAQIETLAILAYRQPITRPEIDDIRGVDSGPVLKLLLERDLIRILGKKDEPGRPLLYGTTTQFLEFFGLKSVKDLPTLREFTELNEDSRRVVERELGETLETVQAAASDADHMAENNPASAADFVRDTLAPPDAFDPATEVGSRSLVAEVETPLEEDGPAEGDSDDDFEDEDEDEDDGHHEEEDLSTPGPPPHESARAITIPLLILATASIVAGLFNPGMLKLISERFDFLPMDHWLEPVFEAAAKGVSYPETHTLHSREWLSSGGAFFAFAAGSYVAYWMYIVKKGKLEATYMSNAIKVAAAFSGAALIVLGGVILALNGKDIFTLKMLVPWALVIGGGALSYHTVKERAVGLDYVYDRSIVVGVDALADTAASVDQGLVDFIIARLTALIVAALGTLLRVVQNGVVHVYAGMMVLGLAILGWFFVQPHANATVADTGNGDYVVTAAPGLGYGYRWYPDARGEAQVKAFTGTDSIKVHVSEGETKTVKVEVRNSFSSGLDLPVVRNLFPPVATKEITVSRPKSTKLEQLGAR